MEKQNSKMQSFWEIVRFVLIALAVVIPIRLFVAEPFVVSGDSMVPTFRGGNYLIVDKLSYEIGSPKRDDVVVFKYPGDTSKYFIKRVIGLPGDTIDIKGNNVTITNTAHPEGILLKQPFVTNMGNNDLHTIVRNNEYYVMGDNRPESSDSRAWGTVPQNLLVGRVLFRLWPINQIDLMPGNYKQSV